MKFRQISSRVHNGYSGYWATLLRLLVFFLIVDSLVTASSSPYRNNDLVPKGLRGNNQDQLRLKDAVYAVINDAGDSISAGQVDNMPNFLNTAKHMDPNTIKNTPYNGQLINQNTLDELIKRHQQPPNGLTQIDKKGHMFITKAISQGNIEEIRDPYLNDQKKLNGPDQLDRTEVTQPVARELLLEIFNLYLISPEFFIKAEKNGWTSATKAAYEGETEVIRALFESNPELLKQSDENGWTPAMCAVYNGKTNVLKVLYELDPELLTQSCKGVSTPATYAAVKGNIEVLSILHELNPELLTQVDGIGWTPATKAARVGKTEVIRVLYELNRELLTQPDKNGWTPATCAAWAGKAEVLKVLYELNPDALIQSGDKDVVTLATLAVFNGKIDVIKVLYELNPDLLTQVDNKYGLTPGEWAILNGQIEILATLYRLDPALVLNSMGTVGSWLAVYTGSVGFALFIASKIIKTVYRALDQVRPQNEPIQRNQIRTTIDVHEEGRDQKAIDAYAKLTAFNGDLPSDYFENIFLSDLGLKRVVFPDIETDLNCNELLIDATHYLIGEPVTTEQDKTILRLAFVLKQRVFDGPCLRLSVAIIPEIGYPDTNGIDELTVDSNQSLSFKNQSYLAGSWHLFQRIPTPFPSEISRRFDADPTFRYALGFATIRPQVFDPVIFGTIERTSISGNDLLSAAHYFCKKGNDTHEIMLRESAFINGILSGIERNGYDPNKWHRLCNLGQLQYLLLPLLQGRLENVLIDNASMPGVIPDPAQLVSVCAAQAETKGHRNTRDDYFKYVEDVFVAETPVLSGPGHDELKRLFFKGIEDEAIFMDPYPWIRDPKERDLALPMLYIKNLLKQQYPNGRTAATHAVMQGNLEVLKGLHVLNPELLTQRDRNGRTPPTLAIYERNNQVIRLLHELNPELLTVLDKSLLSDIQKRVRGRIKEVEIAVCLGSPLPNCDT